MPNPSPRSTPVNTEASRETLTTTALINNLHCSSCVACIREALQVVGSSIWDLDISILSHQVRIRHDANLSTARVCEILNDAAFEIYDATTYDSAGSKISQMNFGDTADGLIEQAAGYWRRSQLATSEKLCHLSPEKRARHVQNCDACKSEAKHAFASGMWPTSRLSRMARPSTRVSQSSLMSKDDNIPAKDARAFIEDAFTASDHLSFTSETKISSTPADQAPDHDKDVPTACAEKSAVVNDQPQEIAVSSPSKCTDLYTALLSISGMTCASCTSAVTHGLEELEVTERVNVTLLTNSASVTYSGPRENVKLVTEKIEDLGYDVSVEDVHLINRTEDGISPRKRHQITVKQRVTLSIEGMTCASCSGAITRGLQELDYVEDVAVDLLTNSGTVIFNGKEHLNQILEKVEDLGYDCTVQECVADRDAAEQEDGAERREVKLSVTGMYCDHCPPRIIDAINASFSDQVIIKKAPTLRDPILEVSYVPQPPHHTIRSIIASITTVDEAFKVSVYRPPTLEQRSRAMQLHERRRLLYRLLLSVIVAVPTFFIGVVWMSLVPATNPIRMFFERPLWSGNVSRADWALFILATPVMFFAADVFHLRAMKEIRALWRRGSKVPVLRRFYRFGSMNLLISAGTSVAYFASLALLIVDATTTSASGNGATYFDSVVFLTFFILIGRFLEAYSKAKAGDAVAMLGKLRPSHALLVTSASTSANGRENNEPGPTTNAPRQIDIYLLETGDEVLIPHGVSPPADGVIVGGSSQFDESSLTGESRPIAKSVGDSVFAGSINIGKPVTAKVTGINGTSMLDQIVSVVREGQTRRAPVERLADVLTGFFVPVITLLAILTFIIWFSLGQSGALPREYLDSNRGGWAFWSIEFAIAVFVVACPCGIGLAAPTAMFVGSGLAAKHGILVRGGGEAFQEASNLDVVVFDKTGTLTQGGNLKVTDHEMLAGGEQERMAWTAAKALEESSGHPLAKAIADFCTREDGLSVKYADIEEIPGQGLRGKLTFLLNDHDVCIEAAIGSESFMTSLGVDIESYFVHHNLTKWKTEGKSIALLAMRAPSQSRDSAQTPFQLVAQFAATDPIRPEAPHVVRRIQEAGMSVYMLSGDNLQTATSVGQAIGIPTEHIIAGVLPTQKAEHIRRLQADVRKRRSSSTRKPKPHAKATVAFLGDGINDAPALAAADVSIAIGSGSDVALSSASFILLTSNLDALLTLLDLSRAVFRRIRFNFAWALVYNLVLLPVAAGVIYPAAGHPRLGPVWASAAMAASSVSVVMSSLALRSGLPGVGFRARKSRE